MLFRISLRESSRLDQSCVRQLSFTNTKVGPIDRSNAICNCERMIMYVLGGHVLGLESWSFKLQAYKACRFFQLSNACIMEPEELLIIHTATMHTRPQLFMCAPCLDMLGASMVRDFSVTAVHACMQ